MLLVLASSFAAAAEPCVPVVSLNTAPHVRVQTMAAKPEPLVRRFVTEEGIEVIRSALRGHTVSSRITIGTGAVHVDHLPGPRTLTSVLRASGAMEGPDGRLRLRGGTPMVVLDGVPLRSDLE